MKTTWIQSRKMNFNLKRDGSIYLLMAPTIVLLLLFAYAPMYGVIISFQDYSPFKGVLKSSWVGLKNFEYFLSDKNFWRVMRNTLIINIYMLLFAFPVPLILALGINEIGNLGFKKIVQSISYLPYFVSWVVIASLMRALLSPTTGLVNKVLYDLFKLKPINFLIEPILFRGILVFSYIWKTAGIMSVYYLATLASINPELYESATIDGASSFQKMLYISIPSLKYIITILFLLQVGNLFSIGFEQVFLLYNPLVYDVGDVISTYTFRLGIAQSEFSISTAIGATQSILNFIMVYTSNRISRRLSGWSLW